MVTLYRTLLSGQPLTYDLVQLVDVVEEDLVVRHRALRPSNQPPPLTHSKRPSLDEFPRFLLHLHRRRFALIVMAERNGKEFCFSSLN